MSKDRFKPIVPIETDLFDTREGQIIGWGHIGVIAAASLFLCNLCTTSVFAQNLFEFGVAVVNRIGAYVAD